MIKGSVRKLAWLAVILLALASRPAPQNTVKGDFVRNIWPNGVKSLDDKNIERYAVNQVQPSYPVLAQRYRIEGRVTVQVQVDGNGKVRKAEFVRGHSIFRSVSLDAAKQWQFRPPDDNTLEGTINFSFKLRD